jgi:predicted membrane-bound mannosyltransferase
VNIITPIALPTAAGARGMTRAGGSSVFEGVNKETCILYVPAGSVDAYKKAAGWNEFKKIYAIGTTAINGVVVSEGRPFDVYNLQGRKVKANTTTFNGLPSGVYIVNGKKVMVK